ncbi:hypothetical protein [Caballeronia hypogeia]|nr:hypothetical protein [Caballeronia hypogeia]
MKRIFTILVASIAVFAAAGAARAADLQSSECQGPATYCNVYFGH